MRRGRRVSKCFTCGRPSGVCDCPDVQLDEWEKLVLQLEALVHRQTDKQTLARMIEAFLGLRWTAQGRSNMADAKLAGFGDA